MYTKIFWDHVDNPRNLLSRDEASIESEFGSRTITVERKYHRCGDKLTLQLAVANGHIVKARFRARACAPVVAVASLGTDKLKGLEISSNFELNFWELDHQLGGLPASKRHAYTLFLECLAEAIDIARSTPTKGSRYEK